MSLYAAHVPIPLSREYATASLKPNDEGYSQRASVLSRMRILWAEYGFTPHTPAEVHRAYWLRTSDPEDILSTTASHIKTILDAKYRNKPKRGERARAVRQEIGTFAGKAVNDHTRLVELRTSLQELPSLRDTSLTLTLGEVGRLPDGTPQLVRQLDNWTYLAGHTLPINPFKKGTRAMAAGADPYTILEPSREMQRHLASSLADMPFVDTFGDPDNPHDPNNPSLLDLSIDAQVARMAFWNERKAAVYFPVLEQHLGLLTPPEGS